MNLVRDAYRNIRARRNDPEVGMGICVMVFGAAQIVLALAILLRAAS